MEHSYGNFYFNCHVFNSYTSGVVYYCNFTFIREHNFHLVLVYMPKCKINWQSQHFENTKKFLGGHPSIPYRQFTLSAVSMSASPLLFNNIMFINKLVFYFAKPVLFPQTHHCLSLATQCIKISLISAFTVRLCVVHC